MLKIYSFSDIENEKSEPMEIEKEEKESETENGVEGQIDKEVETSICENDNSAEEREVSKEETEAEKETEKKESVSSHESESVFLDFYYLSISMSNNFYRITWYELLNMLS